MKRKLKLLAAGIGWIIPALIVAPLAWWSGNDIEELFWPVIAEQSVSNTTFEGGQLCWDFTLVKDRDAIPLDTAWSLAVSGGETYSVLAISRGAPIRASISAPPGVTTTHKICVEVPPGVTPADHIKIEGYGRYLPRHGLWILQQDFASVRWPAN